MARIKTETLPEQVARHLRKGIIDGVWINELPGRDQIAAELGVSPRSVQKAQKLLEKEGLLVAQGQGRRSQIQKSEELPKVRPMRVGFLVYTQKSRGSDYLIELRHMLEAAGHILIIPDKGLQELGMSVKRLEKLVHSTAADAWVVSAGSHPILNWFVENDIKTFALAGRRLGFPIAGTGPDKAKLYGEVTKMLISKGHRRIVMICQKNLRLPSPSKSARIFLQTMNEAGITTGEYNLPDWEASKEGFHDLLNSLFKTTAPTALIVDGVFQFNAAYHYLAQRNLRVPQDVSMVCTDGDPGFHWCMPSVAHMHWEYKPVIRRMARWVDNIAQGVDDRRQNFTKAKYIEGGTVGVAPD